MSDLEHNSAAINDNQLWAQKFVPIPPTYFPKDLVGVQPDEPLVPGVIVQIEDLGEIAGADPFVSPELLTASSPAGKISNQAKSQEMQVEIVGQTGVGHTKPGAFPLESPSLPAPFASTAALEQTEPIDASPVESTPRPHVDQPSPPRSTMPDAFASITESVDLRPEFSAQQDLGSDHETGYWNQFTTASFVPGISPVEAYPVCQEFASQFPNTNQTENLAASPIVDESHFFDFEQLAKSTLELANAESLDREEIQLPPATRTVAAESTQEEIQDEIQAESAPNQEAQQTQATLATTELAPAKLPPNNEVFDVKDSLPQLPNAEETTGQLTGELLFASVENSLSQLQATIEQQDSIGPDDTPLQGQKQEQPIKAEQIIKADGNEGYDFLDLQSFDVSEASFSPGQILLDTGTTRIRVDYQNLNLAVFANKVEVALN